MSFYRGMTCENVTIKGDKGTPITAYVAKPAGPGKFPGVVLIHHLPGWSELYIETTRRFAHHGYMAICANLYQREQGGGSDGNPDDVAAKVRADGGIADAQHLARQQRRAGRGGQDENRAGHGRGKRQQFDDGERDKRDGDVHGQQGAQQLAGMAQEVKRIAWGRFQADAEDQDGGGPLQQEQECKGGRHGTRGKDEAGSCVKASRPRPRRSCRRRRRSVRSRSR